MYENLTRLDLVGPALARALGDPGTPGGPAPTWLTCQPGSRWPTSSAP